LFERSPHRGIQHEPFNQERKFGQVTKDWHENRDDKALRDALREICASQVLIKHCVEKVPIELNSALAEIATEAGYRHIFLYRRRPLGRLLSLHFANVSGVWGKQQAEATKIDEDIYRTPIPIEKLLQHEKKCRADLRGIFDLLLGKGETPNVAVFEDIYFNEEFQAATAILQRLFKALHLERPEEDSQLFDRVLNTGSQGTRSKYQHFVNYTEFVERLEALDDFDLLLPRTVELKTHMQPLPSPIQHAIFWDAEFDPFSGTHTLSGTVVVSPASPGQGELLLQIGDIREPVTWGLPSPKMHQQFPHNPYSQVARFQVVGLNLMAGETAQVIWRNSDDEQYILGSLEGQSHSPGNETQRKS